MSVTSARTFKFPMLTALVFFAIAATLGLTMRFAFVLEYPEWFNYRFVQYAHTHVALLGWLSAIFFIIIIYLFNLKWKKYSKLYWAMQFSVLGMLASFPFIGYESISVVFTTLHIVLSYGLVFKVWRNVSFSKHGWFPVLFLRTSLFFLILSTLGTWSLGPIMALGYKGTAIYYAAIQFYLHFLFNGWFIFVVFAVFFTWLRANQIEMDNKTSKLFYWTLVIGTTLTFALAVSWSTPYIGIFLVNSIGVIIQLLALVLFIKILITINAPWRKILGPYIFGVFSISLLALILKIVIQTVVVIPALAEVSYSIRNFVIGFIHLLMLGGLSLFAFGMISKIMAKRLNKVGTLFFIIGIIVSEVLLFLQGLMQWQGWGFMDYYYELIAISSSFIAVGVIIVLIQLSRVETVVLIGTNQE